MKIKLYITHKVYLNKRIISAKHMRIYMAENGKKTVKMAF